MLLLNLAYFGLIIAVVYLYIQGMENLSEGNYGRAAVKLILLIVAGIALLARDRVVSETIIDTKYQEIIENLDREITDSFIDNGCYRAELDIENSEWLITRTYPCTIEKPLRLPNNGTTDK
jgi:hypothetical protein